MAISGIVKKVLTPVEEKAVAGAIRKGLAGKTRDRYVGASVYGASKSSSHINKLIDALDKQADILAEEITERG